MVKSKSVPTVLTLVSIECCRLPLELAALAWLAALEFHCPCPHGHASC